MLGAVVLLALGLGSRLWFLSAFPTIPFSDFRALIFFGLHLRDGGPTAGGWFWKQFNPGLPLLLSVVFSLVPSDAVAAARTATAVTAGLLPLLPFLLWRGVHSFRLRLLAGLLLALWPGQVFFSGVVAQDNWVLAPAIALGALAARSVLAAEGTGYPVISGLLLVAAVAIRQEMLVVLAPLAAVASLGPRPRQRALRNSARLALATALPLLALAQQRHLATGRLALTTEHGGLALLGTVVPGASAAGWIDPQPFVASVEPSLLDDPERLRSEASRLAVREYGRRPAFHAFRIVTQTLHLGAKSDTDNLFWSVTAAEALPASLHGPGLRFAQVVAPLLTSAQSVLQGLFAAAVIVGLRRRSRAILALAAAVLLKVALHAFLSPMSRLVAPATSLELLTIPVALAELPLVSRRERGALAIGALAVPLLLAALVPPLERRLEWKDRDVPRTYRFPLSVAGVRPPVRCDMAVGRLSMLGSERATIAISEADLSASGGRARVTCALPPLEPGDSLVLRLESPVEARGLPGRMVERVEIETAEVLRHDAATEPGGGWLEVPVADFRAAPGRRVTIEILAAKPDPGWSGGRATTASFEFARRADSG